MLRVKLATEVGCQGWVRFSINFWYQKYFFYRFRSVSIYFQFGINLFRALYYGSFWLTLVAILLMPKMGLADAPNAHFLGMYLGLWGVFTLFMFFGTLKAARMLQFVFLSLTVLFALLAIGHLVDNEGIVKVAGWVGLICGVSAIYLAMGEVLNEQFGRTVLPIGEPR